MQKKISLLSDIHGDIERLKEFVATNQSSDLMVALGDLGVGFKGCFFNFPQHQNFKFIRGNHDNPEKCREHPHYLGEFGYLEDFDLFFISGAWSIDWRYRTLGIDWWRDEQLTDRQFGEALDLYIAKQPKYVISHDCPSSMRPFMQGMTLPPGFQVDTRTGDWLDILFRTHQPEAWYFGHWHESVHQNILGTDFYCLEINEEETFQVLVD